MQNKGPGKKSVPSLQAQLRVWKEPSKVKAEASPVESQEVRGHGGVEVGSREPGYFGTLQGVHAWQGLPCSPTLKGSCQGQEPSLLLVTRRSWLKAPSLRSRQLPRPL